MSSPTLTAIHNLTINIGAIPIVVRTDNADFARMLEDRYGEFVAAEAPHPEMELEIELTNEPGLGENQEPGLGARDPGFGKDDENDEDVSVRLESGRWVIERGSYRAEWDPESKRGWVRQTANPYAIDGVLRILHSLLLARQGGFLVHAASAVRNGRAFVFAGVSGTGKTTLARLAPPDVTLLTDEISYIRDLGHGTRDTGPPITSHRSQIANPQILNRQMSIDNRQSYAAFGTPFAGELARIGQKLRAPLAALFLLQQGLENRIEPLSEGQATKELLRHVLFFARDQELVGMIFLTVCNFVTRVPVQRLVFTPDARVWDLIG